jgi:hypothetical protein
MQRSNKKFVSLWLCALISQSVLLTACGDPPGGTSSTDDEAGEACEPENLPIELEDCSTLASHITGETCLPCYDECHTTYTCYYENGTEATDGCTICAGSLLEADNICQSEDFLDSERAYAQPHPCEVAASCTGWNPAAEITTNHASGAMELDQTFIDSVIADPSVLVGCDTARLLPNVSGPGFVVSGAVAGDLLYGLGLRNGDVPTEINNYPVDDYLEVASAFVALSFTDPSSYTIEVNRPGAGTIYIYVDAL